MTGVHVRLRHPTGTARLVAALTARRAVVAVAAVVAVVGAVIVPPPPVTTAAWTDSERTYGLVGTTKFTCGTDTGYAAAASSRFVRGSLAGTDLDTVAAVRGADLARTRSGVVTAVPASPAPTTDAGGTTTFRNPLSASAGSGLVGLDLTGLGTNLPAGSAGALNQFTRVAPTGTAAAATGLVSDQGGLGVTSTTPASALPGPARVGLTSVLPATTALDRADLTVGAVASTATIDGCRALESRIWGDGSVTGVVRDYGVAGLGLELRSPAVVGLSGQVSSSVASLNTAAAGLGGRDGAISGVVKSGVFDTVNALTKLLSLGSVSGDVVISGLNLQAAVDPLLAGSVTSADGTVTITPATGRVTVDLVKLLGPSGGVNGLAPNTEIVLSATAMNTITATVDGLLDGLTSSIVTALKAAVDRVNLDVALKVDLTATLLGAAVPVLRVDVVVKGSLSQVLASPSTAQASVTGSLLPVLGLGTVLSAVLNGLLTPLANSAPALVGSIASLLTTTLVTPITTLGTTLSTTLAPVVTAVGALTTRLPSVLSLRVNLRPDQAGYPGGVVTTPPADKWSTSTYQVGALRVALSAGATTVTSIDFATSRVGPVSTVPR
ncbi:choice-of-anchor G family protein [Frigoribacterium sp. MCBA15_019]|uniref:choice-of-anchor G family protein n=1 Tax=Frigoribacterium sp. MCBA15_019 TaxID=1898745 RepID=UPI0008DC78FA|nr:choice-of-anchor G family protein [Frigoribacterium sp. MCBA15_019]OII27616.1 hypothetical protein BIV04_03575 [Frigoribacterium sp. MCBA15_019]